MNSEHLGETVVSICNIGSSSIMLLCTLELILIWCEMLTWSLEYKLGLQAKPFL